MEDFSHKEIGEMLGITESASRSQLTRAKAMLRRMLERSVGIKENS
jgi:RNA polymerase sigma-70 factor (ECF subfamily)